MKDELRRVTPGENARELAEADVEVWAPVGIAPTRYWVSNLGGVVSRVRSNGWKRLVPTTMNSGYLSVGIYVTQGARATTCLVHRLVLVAFDGTSPAEASDVRHLDGNAQNNRLTNLQWGTRSENMLDVIEHRRLGKITPEAAEGQVWHQGYTTDEYLLRVGLELYAERKLEVTDLVRLWRCSRDVAENIVHARTHTWLARPAELDLAKRHRRPRNERELIFSMIRDGRSREEVNAAIGGRPLTHQDFYNYKQRAKST